MQSFTDVSVPCEIQVWATETRGGGHTCRTWVRMTLFKDKDLNSR